jgi:hypothetical protein
MKILLPYFSRSGHTERLALEIAARLQSLGHEVMTEKIVPVRECSKWRLALPLLGTLPVLPLYLLSSAFRHWWLARYRQPVQAIRPPAYPDVSPFDCICLGGPKWLYIAYPLARYLEEVRGIQGKPVAMFATFCGPPLEIFEIEMVFRPLSEKLVQRGAAPFAKLAISSGFHEFFFFHEMEYVFRLVSRMGFGRPLRSFSQDSEWGKQQIEEFCSRIDAAARQSGQREGV